MPNQAAESSGDKRDAMVDDVEQDGGEEGSRKETAARITATTPNEATEATSTATGAAETVAATAASSATITLFLTHTCRHKE